MKKCNRREVLLAIASFIGGVASGLVVGRAPLRGERGFVSQQPKDGTSEFRAGSYVFFRGVVLAPSEMEKVNRALEGKTQRLKSSQDVLNFIVP